MEDPDVARSSTAVRPAKNAGVKTDVQGIDARRTRFVKRHGLLQDTEFLPAWTNRRNQVLGNGSPIPDVRYHQGVLHCPCVAAIHEALET